MSIQSESISAYLDWVNNFLTVDRFAEHYNLSADDATTVIALGKKFHEENVDHYKETGKFLYSYIGTIPPPKTPVMV